MKLELKKKLIADVEAKFGPGSGRVIDYLYEQGTLDDILARRHMLKVEFFYRMLTTRTIPNQIYEDLAEDFGVTRPCVYTTVGK